MMRTGLLVLLVLSCLIHFAHPAVRRAPTHFAPVLRDAEKSPRRADSERSWISCSEQDVLVVLERSARQLMRKFDGAMKDVKLLQEMLVEQNRRGGDANPVQRDDMCCCATEDWRELGRLSAWSGYHDCDEERNNELYYGNSSLAGGYGVFTGTRTIDTDLAFLSPASTIFPWLVDRQTESFDRDGFFAAAWMGTNGEVWSYYPGFNQIWPGHFLGDSVGGDYNGREDVFVQPTLPTQNPLRKPLWTQPYLDPAGAGNMISAITPIYFDGPFKGHTFRDEYVASAGIDILLIYMEQLVSLVKPTAGALPMVVDDEGHLVSASPEVVETIFGEGSTLVATIRCDGDDNAISRQLISCTIMSSATADWGWLMDRIKVQNRGQSVRLQEHFAITPRGSEVPVLHHIALFRWEAEDAPPWNSVVLVPVQELADAAKWEAPTELSARTIEGSGAVELQVTMRNTGSVDMTFTLKSVPYFATIKEMVPLGAANARIGDPVSFPSGRTVLYTLLLEARLASGAGTHRTTMAFEVADDEYPDCLAQNEVNVAITLVVEAKSTQNWLVIAAILASLSAVAIGALIFTVWKRRQADKLWSVKLRDLHFKTDPPEVLGRGTYGMVVAAEFRKTMVAVKRVIPPSSSPSKHAMFGWGSAGDDVRRLLDQLFALTRDPVTGVKPLPPGAPESAAQVYASLSQPAAWRLRRASSGSFIQRQAASSGRQWSMPCLCVYSQRDRLIQSFIHEMRLLAELRHPCITTMMGAVVEKSCEPMLIMELMDYGSLKDIIHNPTVELSGELVIPMLRQVAQGLTYLHHYPIVHGDVSAKNVLVDSQFRAKVADFGLSAKKYSSSGPAGTPFWMAPELLRGEGNSAQSDVYAFGVTMWEVYARAEPYYGEDAQSVLLAVANLSLAVDTTGLSAKRPKMPDDIAMEAQRIIRDCWHTDPTCRPPSEEIDRMLKTLDTRTMGPTAKATNLAMGESMLSPINGKGKRGPVVVFSDAFPKRIADRMAMGQAVQSERKEEVTIVFVGVSRVASSQTASEDADASSALYSHLEELAKRHGLFTVDTVDDTFMVVANLEDDQGHDHAVRAAAFALDALDAVTSRLHGFSLAALDVRLGVHSGPAIGNVVGSRTPRFSLFGDSVSTALWLCTSAEPSKLQCSQRTANTLRTQVLESGGRSPSFDLVCRGSIEVRGKGEMTTFWVSRPAAGTVVAAPEQRSPSSMPSENVCGFPGLRIPLRTSSVSGALSGGSSMTNVTVTNFGNPPDEQGPEEPPAAIRRLASTEEEPKFVVSNMVFGHASIAAEGLNVAIGLDDRVLAIELRHGCEAMEREFFSHGSDEDKQNFEYCYHAHARQRDQIPEHMKDKIAKGEYHGGALCEADFDEGHDGMTLDSFIKCEESVLASLTRAEVLALRLYTTSSYGCFTKPLRDQVCPHPFRMCVYHLSTGLKKLRAVAAKREPSRFAQKITLWRGLKNVCMDVGVFLAEGGTEVAPMSTTTEMQMALRYAESESPVLMQINAAGLSQGCSLRFLSVFPKEKEFLYPPLTYLHPVGQPAMRGHITVVQVEPQIP